MNKEDEIVDLFDPVKNISKISSIVSSVENIKRMISFLKPTSKRSGGNDDNSPTTNSANTANTIPNDISVNYTGLHTDIAFVSTTKDGIDRKSFEAIDDNILKRNVLESFDDAVSDGFLTCENGKYTLTNKGKEHINSPAFIKQFEKDQKYNLTNSENRAVFEFKGEPQDVDIFRYTNSFDLNKLNVSDNIVAVDKVNSYFKKLEKTGFVIIDKNKVVTPTEKTLKYLSQQPTKNFSVKAVTSNNINEVVNTVASIAKSPNTVAVITEVTKVAFQKLQQKISQENNTHSNSRH
ncbi:MAG: hypothetical protein UH241_02870 [Acutalibacteraceae bacterium]|nr:hypothetical protein [Acutalibacteraceae bacterium]